MTSSEHDLAHYARISSRHALLTPEEEVRASTAWRRTGDPRALDPLVLSHMRMVPRIANRMKRHGIPVQDLAMEGVCGLLKAAERFDPDQGFRFATYAGWWIRASIYEHVATNSSSVKIPANQKIRRLIFGLSHMKARAGILDGEALRGEDLRRMSSESGIGADLVAMVDALLKPARSMDAPTTDDPGHSLHDVLASSDPDPFEEIHSRQIDDLRRKAIEAAAEDLTPRESDILLSRILSDEPETLDDLSVRHGVSRERIRQIEVAIRARLSQRITRAWKPATLLG